MKTIPILLAAALIVPAMFYGSADSAAACKWEGKAPFCNGQCQPGWVKTGKSKTGGGKKCMTGMKVRCCQASNIIIRGTAPLCSGRCKTGEERVGSSGYGPKGVPCLTGKAAICRRPD